MNSQAPVNVAEPAAQQERRTSRAWLRWGLGAWWVVILYLALNLRDTVVSALWPALHDWLQALLALVASWLLWAQIGFGVLVALALGGLAWLTYLAFWTWRKAEQEAARAEKAGRIEELKEGNKPLQQPLEQLVELTKEQNELLSQRQEQEAPPLSPGVIAPTGMPRAASLIGRDAVLADLMAKLRAGATMGVFALRGMGGVGKTALAAEAVARLASEQDSFPGGAAWISCENLTGSEGLTELWGHVARALRLEQVASQPDPQTRRAALANALARRPRLLLALDNIEPGLDAETALDTLAIAGHTALLLTARQPVAPNRLESIEIKPLDPPPAAELFRQRLRQVAAARPTAEDERAVPALLEALGGLPLALELTAAYAGLQRLPLADVLREVEADGLRAAALQGDPQRALEARFDRSWLKLSGRQQRLFAALSLLAGASFPRDAALMLADATEDLAEPPEARPGSASDVAKLVDYALVEPLERGRLRLHSLLREYAAQQLAKLSPALWEHLGDTMAVYWLAYAQEHSDYEGMDALEAEIDGLIGALTWAYEHARHSGVLALAHALNRFWFVRGRIDEARRARLWALEAAKSLNNGEEERWATHELAVVDSSTGQLEKARIGFERALELAQQSGNLVGEQIEIQSLALVDEQMGRLAAARIGNKRALELAQQLKDLRAEQVAVHSLAVLDSRARRVKDALAGFRKALELAGRLGDSQVEATELMNLGAFISQLGDTSQGHQLLQQSLKIYEALKHTRGVGECNQFLAQINELEGNRAGAIACYCEALCCFEQVQSPDAEEVRAALRRLEEGEGSAEDGWALTPEEMALAVALRAFLTTQSWEETRAVLESKRALLLSDTASQFLAEAVKQARQADREDAVAYLELHRTLLARAREVGIDAAWAQFEAARRATDEQTGGEPAPHGGE